MIRPHLEYSVQFQAPHRISDITELEKGQGVTTRCIPGMRHLSYPERVERLKLFGEGDIV